MKNIFFVFFIVAVSCSKNMKQNFKKEAREKHVDFIKGHSYQKILKLSQEELKRNGIPPNKYYEQEYLLEINPSLGRSTPENLLEVQENLKSKEGKLKRSPGDGIDNSWVDRGPNNIGGRTRVLLFDPNDKNNANSSDDYNRVFAGAVSGGLWVNDDITDENSGWSRVGISENLGVSSITVDPNNSMIWYAGTGESYTSNDGAGSGLWKSTDGGFSWFNLIPVNFSNSEISRLYTVNDVRAWDNAGSTEVFMAASREFDYQNIGYQITGLWKSSDSGSNWTRVDLNTPSGSPYEVNSIKISKDNSIWVSTRTNAYGKGGGKIFKSIDGLSFVEKYSFTDGHRVEISCSRNNTNTIYALAELKTGFFPFSTPYLNMVKNTDGFETATIPETVELTLPNDVDTGIPADDFTRGQAFYDLLIQTDPSNDDIVYVGGIDLFRSTDSGATWSQISKWSNNNALNNLDVSQVHADQHEMVFRPNSSNEALFGNDGGVYYANNLSGAALSNTAISSRNIDYNVTQIYKGAIGQDANNEIFLGGAQDNGSLLIETAAKGANEAIDVFGGDGAYEFIDKDGAYMIVSYVYNTYAILSMPYTGAGSMIVNDGDSGEFINPADLDDHLEILYTNSTRSGVDSIARYSDLLTTPVRTNFTDPLLVGGATAFKVSPFTTSSTTLFLGTSAGKVLKITNADTTPIWTDIDLSENIAVGSISSIEFGSSESEIFVTLHNYGIENIWYTTNGGVDWVSKDGDFPDIPVKAIMKNPSKTNEVIIGTNLGVWMSSNFLDVSPNWIHSQNGMSNVKITSFDYREVDDTVLASTYGRGLFTGVFTSESLSAKDVTMEKNQIRVYPTISNGNFIISASKDLTIQSIEITNSKGISIYTSGIKKIKEGKKIEISIHVIPGVYFVNLYKVNGESITKQIIIK